MSNGVTSIPGFVEGGKWQYNTNNQFILFFIPFQGSFHFHCPLGNPGKVIITLFDREGKFFYKNIENVDLICTVFIKVKKNQNSVLCIKFL